MAQARTLDEAQTNRLRRYSRTRLKHTRCNTIFTFAYNADEYDTKLACYMK